MKRAARPGVTREKGALPGARPAWGGRRIMLLALPMRSRNPPGLRVVHHCKAHGHGGSDLRSDSDIGGLVQYEQQLIRLADQRRNDQGSMITLRDSNCAYLVSVAG